MADFEEIVHLKVKYDEAVARKAKWDIETLQAKAAGIQITPTLKQESFRRAAAQLDALTNLRHATVRVNVDSRSVNDSLASLKNSINNTKFSVQLDKTGFENKLRELELKLDQLGEKFRVGFKTKLDADAAVLSMRKLQQEADTLHHKLNRRETVQVSADSSAISTLSEALKNAVINAGSLHRMVGAISPQVLAGAAAFALLAGSVALTAAAVGGAVVGIGAIAAAALSSNETVKTSYAGMVAEIKNSVTGMS